jgi:hypothetical protein
VRLAEQWEEIERSLPADWKSARLSLTVAADADPERVALIVASLAPGRVGPGFRFEARPDKSPATVLRRLDREGIRGRVDSLDVETRAPEPVRVQPAAAHEPLAAQWDALAADFPPDWSDVYGELSLDSSDFVARGALLAAPMNPARFGGANVLRFRSASRAGYGTAPEMVRRCLERLDRERITGSIRVLRLLSHTTHVSTQGPVWRVGGRSV